MTIPEHIDMIFPSNPEQALDMFMNRDKMLYPCSDKETKEFIDRCQKQIELNKPVKSKDEIWKYEDITFNFTKWLLQIAESKRVFTKDGLRLVDTDKDKTMKPKSSKRDSSILWTLCLMIYNLREGKPITEWNVSIYEKYRSKFGKKKVEYSPEQATITKNMEWVMRLLKFCWSRVRI